MRTRITLLLVFAMVVGGCSDPLQSEEYLALQDAVAELEREIGQLDADIDEAESEYAQADSDVAALLALRIELAGLLDEVASRQSEHEDLEDETAALEVDLSELASAVLNTDGDLRAAMDDSSAFSRWVRDQNRVADRWACAEDVVAYFAFFGGFQESPASLMDEPPPESELLRLGREVLDMPVDDGCDGWYPGATGGVWSMTTVFDKLCQTIDIELLAESPEEVTGDCVSGWGHVIVFDQDNEPCRLEANIGEVNTSKSSYEVWVQYRDPTGVDCDWLFALDEGDEFRFWAVQDGIVSVTDENGDPAMIPTFNMLRFIYWYRTG